MDAVANAPPDAIEIGHITCPVTGEVINTYLTRAVGEMPSFFLSNFNETRLIASGGYGIVVECRNKSDTQSYAIKKIPVGHDPNSESSNSNSQASQASSSQVNSQAPSFASLIREVTTWSKLDHKNVVRYFESWIESNFCGEDEWEMGEIDKDKPCLYIQLQLCDSSLKTKLQPNPECANNWITKKECAQTFEDLVLGLLHIHAEGIMHGDISSANILFRNGVAKITDFGLARTIGAEDDEVDSIGLSLYQAPERKRAVGKAKPHTNADIFSLGILLFEMLQPFTTNFGRQEVLTRLGCHKIFPEGWKDEAIKDWVLQMVVDPPSERATADYLKKHLEEIREAILSSKQFPICNWPVLSIKRRGCVLSGVPCPEIV